MASYDIIKEGYIAQQVINIILEHILLNKKF